MAKERNIPIRVGVNSGSLEKHLIEKYHGVTAEGIVESALDKVKLIDAKRAKIRALEDKAKKNEMEITRRIKEVVGDILDEGGDPTSEEIMRRLTESINLADE